jgi:hypothetical protein
MHNFCFQVSNLSNGFVIIFKGCCAKKKTFSKVKQDQQLIMERPRRKPSLRWTGGDENMVRIMVLICFLY